jgi:hypothetical protein
MFEFNVDVSCNVTLVLMIMDITMDYKLLLSSLMLRKLEDHEKWLLLFEN